MLTLLANIRLYYEIFYYERSLQGAYCKYLTLEWLLGTHNWAFDDAVNANVFHLFG